MASYRQKISGPLLDRIDMHLQVPRVCVNVLADEAPAECSLRVAGRVRAARDRQRRRGGLNAHLAGSTLTEYAAASSAARTLLEEAAHKFKLSARAQHKILRLARTIADLSQDGRVDRVHVAEAVALRCLDAIS